MLWTWRKAVVMGFGAAAAFVIFYLLIRKKAPAGLPAPPPLPQGSGDGSWETKAGVQAVGNVGQAKLPGTPEVLDPASGDWTGDMDFGTIKLTGGTVGEVQTPDW